MENKFDLNGDGKVNIIDLVICVNWFKKLDFNEDGRVDIQDIDILLSEIKNNLITDTGNPIDSKFKQPINKIAIR